MKSIRLRAVGAVLAGIAIGISAAVSAATETPKPGGTAHSPAAAPGPGRLLAAIAP